MILKSLFFCILIAYSFGSKSFTLQTETHTYIVCTEEDALLVIDRQTSQESLVKVGRSPRSMVIYKQKGFVVNAYSNTISVINLETHTLVKEIWTGQFPFKMVQHGMFAYVLHAESNNVLIVNLNADECFFRISDYRLAEQQDIVVENMNGYVCANNCILVFPIDQCAFHKIVEVDRLPYRLVFYRGKGYVLHYMGPFISVIDLGTFKVSSKLPIEGCPKDMALYGSYLYVVCARASCLEVFDLDLDKKVKTIRLEVDPTTIEINKDLAFVTHAGFRSISIVDLYAQSVIAFIQRNEESTLGFSDSHLYVGSKKLKPLSLYEKKLFDQPYSGILGNFEGDDEDAIEKFEKAFEANQFTEAKIFLEHALALGNRKAFAVAAYAFLHHVWGAKDTPRDQWFMQFFAFANVAYFEELALRKRLIIKD